MVTAAPPPSAPSSNGHVRSAGAKGRAKRAPAANTATAPLQPFPTGGITRMGTGRTTVDTPYSFTGAPSLILPPPHAEAAWQAFGLDEANLARFSPARVMQLLADLSPDVSRALFDFLRLSNAGWDAKVTRPGKQDTPYPEAQAALDTFLDRLDDLYGSVDVVFNRLFLGAWLRGAFLAELVLVQGQDAPVDLATPDPATARFKLADDPLRGKVWQLGQLQPFAALERAAGRTAAPPLPAAATGMGFVPLDVATVRYVPVDPFPGSPYGRPLVSPALFTTLFLLGLLHDLRRVVAQQGYPRLDISIALDRLKATMPAAMQEDAALFREWVAGSIAEVQAILRSLQPDDTYVHTDVNTVNRPVGAIDASVMGGAVELIDRLEAQATRALKSSPLLMGDTGRVSEAAANRLWEAHLQGIKSLQHLAEGMLERLFGLALQWQGYAATVQLRFAENRASEEGRDAITLHQKIVNAALMYARGWVDQDEAAQMVVGHAPDQPEPRIPTAAISSGGPGGGGGGGGGAVGQGSGNVGNNGGDAPGNVDQGASRAVLPPTPTPAVPLPPRRLVRRVERDADGRITAVIEDEDDVAAVMRRIKRVERDEGGRITAVTEQTEQTEPATPVAPVAQ